MISNQPDPARRSYAPGLMLSAVGGATVTRTLFDSSSRVNARLSGGTGGHPVGGVTAVRTEAGPRARLGTGAGEGRGPRDPPSMGQRRPAGPIAAATVRGAKSRRRAPPAARARAGEA